MTESGRLQSHLLAETARNEAIIGQLKSLMGQAIAGEAGKQSKISQHDFSFLTSTPSAKALGLSNSGSALQSITTNTKFALSQVPALRSLLADLRPRLASLQSSATKSDSGRAARTDERSEYIEQRTRLHLQRHGESASVDDSGISGKRVEPEEIEALEKVADIFDTD